MKVRIRDALLALALVVVAWSPVEAQETQSSVFPAPGSEVRGQFRSETVAVAFEGFLVSSSPGEVEIRTLEAEPLRFESAALAVLEVKRRTAGAGANKGWKIGAAITGVIFGVLVAQEADNTALGFVYGGVLGAVPGALVGGILGAAVGASSWERVW